MRDLAYDAATTRPSPLEVSFTFQPANDRSNGKHPDPSVEPGNVPRISRLMALAIRFDGLVRRGEVRDYADLARLGYVTRGPSVGWSGLLEPVMTTQYVNLFCQSRM